MSKQELEQLTQAEDLLAKFLNRSGEPDESLVLDALTILSTLTDAHNTAQKELENSLEGLNQAMAEARWAANPDRMGGQFTADEINDSGRWI